MAEQTARDAKLVQYLTEAYTTEKQLETALEAHIGMSTRAPLKKRRQEHLRETKRHARELERRIKKLGGQASTLNEIAAEATTVAATLVGKAMAAAQGPLHAVRGTGKAEIELKNARTEYQSEAEEIAHYTIIETLATAVGDKETAQLAKSIRREEERMARFLERQLPTLTKAVATESIPAAERNGGTRRRTTRRTSSASARSGRSARSKPARSSGSSRASGSARSKPARSKPARSSGSSRGKATRSSSRTSGSARKAARSSGSRSRRSR
jgi:ferritin-like metal-binding protein YciE